MLYFFDLILKITFNYIFIIIDKKFIINKKDYLQKKINYILNHLQSKI